MLNFCDFIQVYVFTTNHHLKVPLIVLQLCKLSGLNVLKETYDFRVSFCFTSMDHTAAPMSSPLKKSFISVNKKNQGTYI